MQASACRSKGVPTLRSEPRPMKASAAAPAHQVAADAHAQPAQNAQTPVAIRVERKRVSVTPAPPPGFG